MFERIKSILTIKYNNYLKMENYTLYFEEALHNTFLKLFPGIKCLGFYYHYCRNLREKAKEYKLLNKENNDITNKLLKELYKLPFIYNNNPESIA